MCGETKIRGTVKIITVVHKQWVSSDIKGMVRKWIHVKKCKEIPCSDIKQLKSERRTLGRKWGHRRDTQT